MTRDAFLAYMTERGVSVRGLAKRLGVSAATVSRWRAGESPIPPWIDYVAQLERELERRPE